MNIVSCITARGGSKGIPKKNIIDLNGKPLLYYSIKASTSSIVNKTFVSTDDTEISDIALSYNVGVIDRPKALSDDNSKSDDSLLHFAGIIDFDILVFIQPTSPLIKSEYIDKGVKMIMDGKYDSVFSANKEHWIPKWDMNIQTIDWDINNRPMRQDKPELYVENGMFYITTRESLLSNKLRYGNNIGVVEIPIKDSFQIDTYEDLELMRRLIK